MVGRLLRPLADDVAYLVVYLLVSIQNNPILSVSRVYDHVHRMICMADSFEVIGNHTAISSRECVLAVACRRASEV